MILDQESRDANSLLVELDRGLQSQNIGEQSEAVARFSSLFHRYPLPILINSACLKLAETFRCGSNFIRVQICEVFERNQIHISKIYSIDDFYRNLFAVTSSNDPIARSITLLTLGHIAPVVSSYKSVHHCISVSLESTLECELNAAVACAACYVNYSSEFACNIYPKIVSIIDSKKSPLERKIRALSVLDHGFYNANDALTVRSFLINVIEKSTSIKLTCSCLTLSTRIAFTSLSHIMPQIDLLLNISLNDTRLAIKINALKNLVFLAERSPHIWQTSHVSMLISHLEKSSSIKTDSLDNQNVCAVLSIFCKLLTCKCNFISQEVKNQIFHECYNLALNNSNLSLCSMAFELLTVMSEEYSFSPGLDKSEFLSCELIVNTFTAIKQFLTDSLQDQKSRFKSDNSNNESSIDKYKCTKVIYRHIAKLCQLNPHYSRELVEMVYNRISSKDVQLKYLSPYVTELLCAVVQSSNEPIVSSEAQWKLIKSKATTISDTNLINLCVLYFQTLTLESSVKVASDFIEVVIQDRSLWFGFKVMRQAMRYGQHNLAELICRQLQDYVTNDTTDFYFKSLHQICEAESILAQNSDLDSNLKLALPIYEAAVSPLRASVSHSRTTNFQLQLLWLKIRMLHTHSALRQCWKTFQASPITYNALLNAIGATRGTSDPVILKIEIAHQMPKIAKEFRHLGDCYENLSVVSFDCDNNTLEYLVLMKSSCVIMADAIDAIFQYGKNLPVISKLPLNPNKRLALEHRSLEAVCSKLIDSIRTEILKPGIVPSNKSIDPLMSLLKNFSDQILMQPSVYPRYFFQPLQMTRIKLAITPQASSSSGSISLLLNNNLVLKVEGLIQNHLKTRSVIRKISKIMVSISMVSSKAPDNNFKVFVQSTTEPRNNYFKTEFLLPLKLVGSFNVDVEVSIIDEEEKIWKTGPTEKLSVLVS